ncbi:ribosomal protein L7/L12 [Kitasatospora sp. NPDC051705]|uniref:ribosomal protein L7/L12 n=1 Tax=Kitasatospora sp. NPDC051705 TaxID=3364057 RepID=UPI0037AA0282
MVVEEPEFSVLLTEVGTTKLDVIQAVRAISGLSLWHSKLLLEAAPVVVVEDAWFEAADKVAKRLEAAGARAVLVCGWCDRRIPSGAVGLDPDPCESPYWPAESCRASSPPTEQTKK